MSLRGRTVVLVVIVSMAVSSLVTTFLLQSANPLQTIFKQDEDVFTEGQEKLQQVFNTLTDNYIRPVDQQKLLNGAIEGMVKATGDPYSEYMDAKKAEQFHSDLKSSFSGIGASVTLENGRVKIYSIIKNSPAEKSGLQIDDLIVTVNGESLEGLNLEDAVSKIRGPKGSQAQLDIIRNQEKIKVSVIRDEISIDTVSSNMLPGKIGQIAIHQFTEKTDQEFATQLAQLEKQGMKGLIIDVRGNPGGLLPKVLSISESLIPKGKVIMSTEEKNKTKEVYKGKADSLKPYPISVLIDKGSASASEILAAGLQEAGGYQIVGETSYGKGTVQTAIDFADGSNLKLTIAKWLTPNGNWIDKLGGTKGVKPDVEVKPAPYTQYKVTRPKETLKRDTHGQVVASVQNILTVLGYHSGRTDGYFDQKTEDAIQSFQTQNQIAQTGQIDTNTVDKLVEAYGKLIEDPKHDKQLQVAIRLLQQKVNQ